MRSGHRRLWVGGALLIALAVVALTALWTGGGDGDTNTENASDEPGDETTAPGGPSTGPTGSEAPTSQTTDEPTTSTTSPPDTVSEVPTSQTLPDGRLLPPDESGRAASDLKADGRCREDNPRRGVVDLRWAAATVAGVEQRVQLTIFPEGFETGRYFLSESLPPDATALVWDQPQGQAIHQWRVLTRSDDGWVPSETARFTGPMCISDEG